MSDERNDPPPAPQPDVPHRRVNWGRRLVVVALAAVAVLLVALLGSAFIPRWWAQRIGDQVDGSFATGAGLGLFYGFVFTGVALVALWFTFHKRRPWKVWATGLVAALILAAPNLMTLGIVIGRGNAAHAGERILDVEAPAFRGACLIGAAAALVVVAAWRYVAFSRRRTKREIGKIKGELDSRRRAAEAAAKGDESAT